MKKILIVILIILGAMVLYNVKTKQKTDSTAMQTTQEEKVMKQKVTKDATKQITLVLDPGHGGSDAGASKKYHGVTISEKNLNLKIATYLKKELESYEGVKVYLTREDDTTLGIEDRTNFAKEKHADALISLHNNAKGTVLGFTDGCSVLTASGTYKKELAERGQSLGSHVLYQLSEGALVNQGLVLRMSENGSTYPDGSLSDYYGIIRRATLQNQVGIIIEHAFVDWREDYESSLNTSQKLKTLAQKDAKGIAAYYQLKKEQTNYQTVDVEQKVVYITDGKQEHNTISKRNYRVRQ